VSAWVNGCLERGPPPLPPAASCSPRGVSLGVMSKAFGLAGLRMGWLAMRDQSLRSSIAKLKDYTTICNAAPIEVLSLAALRAKDQLLARAREILSTNVALLAEFFDRNADRFAWVRQRGVSRAARGRRRRLRRAAGGARRRLDSPGLAVRLPRKPLSRRVRPAGYARGPWHSRTVRKEWLRRGIRLALPAGVPSPSNLPRESVEHVALGALGGVLLAASPPSRTGRTLARGAGLALIAYAASPLLSRLLRAAAARRRQIALRSFFEVDRSLPVVFAFFKDFENL